MEYSKQQFLTYDDFTRQFACDYSMPLARGGHGEIYRGVDLETNEEVAIKRRLYSIDDNALTLEKEYAHTQAVPPNRFVVRYLYYGRYATPFGTYEFLVMRFYRDGNLTSPALTWQSLTTTQQQRFVNEFLQGLNHLHTHNIVHRDIKPENVLLVRYTDAEGTAFRPVIADFGISKMMTDHPEAARAFVQNSMRIGTVTYMAPEQLRTENIDYNADLWSFGIILYELITGKHMIARRSFPETQREEAYEFWRNAGEDRFPDDMRRIAQPYQQIIRQCLVISRDERVQSAKELLSLLVWQPDLLEAEQAFRQQNWAGVVNVLEPVIDRIPIPDVAHWLQQARLQLALTHTEQQVPQVEPKDDLAGPVQAANDDQPTATTTWHNGQASQPEPAAGDADDVPDDYDSQQTELFDNEADWFVKKPVVGVIEPFVTEVTPANAPAPVVDKKAKTGLFASWFGKPKVAPVTAKQTTDTGDVAVEKEAPIENQLDLFEPSPTAVTGVFDEPLSQEPDVIPPTDRPADGIEEDEAVQETTVNEPIAAESTVADTVAEEPAPLVSDNETGRPSMDQPADNELVSKVAGSTPIGVTTLKSPALDRMRVRVDKVVNRARQSKNRPLLIGGGLILGLLILFSIAPNKPAESNVVQLDPKESYETSLKRFRQYSRTYEKTGQLNAYMWAFIHCNPAYEDSLSQSVVRRAGAVLAQHKLIFATDLGNVNVLKRQEMKNLLKDRISWEVRPHPLSDENCLPRK
ncbi:serine/threonine protein kinase [Fibrella sp. HMF5335]|uniref:Serine/threonine protein kinase n=1 Tax=Fibrella rubiginis TaxID=2817060 RepID=A0A939GFD6_9BACT|nr:serine/threonine-protein kinase [Fibrella rubiginis]MBO0936778.1 serine/threonine protein kinase [Fibrella rubiginis]